MRNYILIIFSAIFLSIAAIQTPAQPGTTLVSAFKPDGITLFAGNVYFTSHDPIGAVLWQTGENSKSGDEAIMYWEPRARFGDISFAQIDGKVYGYFFSQRTIGNPDVSFRRISVADGAVSNLGTVPNIDVVNTHRNLVTDGVNLYWQDSSSVRKYSLTGGPIVVLDSTSLSTPTAGIAMLGDRIIYADGKEIRYVPKAGTIITPLARIIFTATSRVTTLNVIGNDIYWGEQNGAIRRKTAAGVETLRPNVAFVPTSVAANSGSSVMAWTDCTSQSCRLQTRYGNIGLTQMIQPGAFGASIGAGGKVFWGDAAGVHRK